MIKENFSKKGKQKCIEDYHKELNYDLEIYSDYTFGNPIFKKIPVNLINSTKLSQLNKSIEEYKKMQNDFIESLKKIPDPSIKIFIFNFLLLIFLLFLFVKTNYILWIFFIIFELIFITNRIVKLKNQEMHKEIEEKYEAIKKQGRIVESLSREIYNKELCRIATESGILKNKEG